MLESLKLRNIGPAPQMDFAFSPRMNLLTGDNGLGKTFVLDLVWWACTGSWAGRAVRPDHTSDDEPGVELHHRDQEGHQREAQGQYSREEQELSHWGVEYDGLVINARIDGGFSVWDPFRERREFRERDASWLVPGAFDFDPDALWNGLTVNGRIACNGLIRDWVSWQKGNESSFALLERALLALSPPDEPLRPGRPTRISLADAREIPTLSLPYGEIPVVDASAGYRRILSLAYLLVWAWQEHRLAARFRKKPPSLQAVMLVDELEAHLHPRWQRSALRALLGVMAALTGEDGFQVQLIATTHSPLVLAAAEPLFDEGRDRVFHFGQRDGHVELSEIPWSKQGDAVNWLTSEVFGLQQARSIEAERAIEAAEAFMRGDHGALPTDLSTQEAIHAELIRVLAGHDPFWPRWIVRQGGVEG